MENTTIEHNQIQEIELKNGNKILAVLPKTYNKLVIVDLETIQRLISNLSSEFLTEMKDRLINEIRSAKDLKSTIEVLKKEVNFQETVNLISHIDPNLEVKFEKQPSSKQSFSSVD